MSAELSPSDKAKMRTAQSLIKEHRYSEARALLVQVDHPKATEWLMRIDAIPKPAPPKKSNWKVWLSMLILIAVIIGAGYAVWSRNENLQAQGARAFCSMVYAQDSTDWMNCLKDNH